jgi:hypothetical protein
VCAALAALFLVLSRSAGAYQQLLQKEPDNKVGGKCFLLNDALLTQQ